MKLFKKKSSAAILNSDLTINRSTASIADTTNTDRVSRKQKIMGWIKDKTGIKQKTSMTSILSKIKYL